MHHIHPSFVLGDMIINRFLRDLSHFRYFYYEYILLRESHEIGYNLNVKNNC